MDINLVANLAKHLMEQAPRLLGNAWEAVAPFVQGRVTVTLRVDVDGPANLDPVFEVKTGGYVDATGLHFDGIPQGKVVRYLS